MKTTFMHYRKYDRNGQMTSKGGMTLAVQLDGNQLTIALAECGRKDAYNRKLGRTIAEGRLQSRSASHLFRVEMPAYDLKTTDGYAPSDVRSFVHNQQFVRERCAKLMAGGK